MVKVSNVSLSTSVKETTEGKMLEAELEFDVDFTTVGQTETVSYEVVGGLVEVDGPLDDYDVEEELYRTDWGFWDFRKILHQDAEGPADDNLGIIGVTTRDSDVGRETITFTRSLGRVERETENGYRIETSGTLEEGVLDDDEESLAGDRVVTSELRGLVRVLPTSGADVGISADSTKVEFFDPLT
ncbi:hypothetical protein NDI56_01610 [Haloarcula sp. S1CR25-12]|uniref:Uncharacterized protein n=1 Tax=Haloarcula saliterrae TaxID=2950534 RepID=A0ABU2F7C0_9EURY|nr:hypothetical protein [Haloarcula sp. S1CR25-12]MDS0258101.1 hypothetical protein [Haloarcula sp. S1CR25-12]